MISFLPNHFQQLAASKKELRIRGLAKMLIPLREGFVEQDAVRCEALKQVRKQGPMEIVRHDDCRKTICRERPNHAVSFKIDLLDLDSLPRTCFKRLLITVDCQNGMAKTGQQA